MELLQRLKNRPDSEHGQAFARFIIVATGVVYSTLVYRRGADPRVLEGALFLAGYLLFSIAIIALIIINPAASPARRYVAMVSDTTGAATALYLFGQIGTVFLWAPLFLVVGYGLRYGRRYLYTAMGLGTVSYLVMAANTAYWRNDPYLAIGYAGCFVILPLYFASLLKQLSKSHAELAKLAEAMKNVAQHDALTGLPNRFLFHEELTHELANAQRHGTKLGLLFIDLDGFKTINDTLGHPAGDTLLKTVADRLSARLRKSDVVARLSGDEFVVMVGDADRDAVRRVTHKVIAEIAKPVEIDGKTAAVTASIGIAIFPESATTADGLMAKADAAMYQAKQAGKNRMMLVGDPGPEAVMAVDRVSGDIPPPREDSKQPPDVSSRGSTPRYDRRKSARLQRSP